MAIRGIVPFANQSSSAKGAIRASPGWGVPPILYSFQAKREKSRIFERLSILWTNSLIIECFVD